jgi:hypothetical protein
MRTYAAAKEEEIALLQREIAAARQEVNRARDQEKAQNDERDAAANIIAAVTPIKLPEFWVKDPLLWFRQCESAFRRSSIVSSGVKFDHVVMKLPHDVSLSCRSLLLSIKFEDKDAYEQLKEHLCRSFGRTKWQLAFSLLDSPQLGDRRPSQLLQDLRALLPHGELEGTLFQSIFLKRLPDAMSNHILAANIDEMAILADRLHDKPSHITAVSNEDDTQRVHALNDRTRPRDSRSPDRRPQQGTYRGRGGGARGSGKRGGTTSKADGKGKFNRDHTPARQWVKGAQADWCSYHQYYGEKAINCLPGCNFSGN